MWGMLILLNYYCIVLYYYITTLYCIVLYYCITTLYCIVSKYFYCITNVMYYSFGTEMGTSYGTQLSRLLWSFPTAIISLSPPPAPGFVCETFQWNCVTFGDLWKIGTCTCNCI